MNVNPRITCLKNRKLIGTKLVQICLTQTNIKKDFSWVNLGKNTKQIINEF